MGVYDDETFLDDRWPEDDEVECKYCGDGPFWWTGPADRRRLVDEDEVVHNCRRNGPAEPGDFPRLKS